MSVISVSAFLKADRYSMEEGNQRPHINLHSTSHWYITQKSYDNQMDYYWNVGSRLTTYKKHKYIFYDFEALMKLSLDESHISFLSIPSAGLGYQLNDIQRLSYLNSIQAFFGRYKKKWSWMDSFWQLGLWNPLNLFDYFNPEELGLIGSAVVFEGPKWALTSFIGGVFLPNEQSALGENKSGTFRSKSRWSAPPAPNVSILDKELDSYYWLQTPYLTNVLFQTSYLVNLLIGEKTDKWISISYAHKPIYQNFYRVKSGLNISNTTLDNLIYYHPLKHHLTSVESNFQWGRLSINLAATNESLDPVNLSKNWIVPNIPNSMFFTSASLSTELNFSRNKNLFQISYLKSWIKGTNNDFLIGKGIDSLLPLERFKLIEGLSFNWNTSFVFKGYEKLKSVLKYWYSIDQKGGFLQWKLSFFINPHFSTLFECNILGSERPRKEGFFSRYGNNDRLSLKVQYDF